MLQKSLSFTLKPKALLSAQLCLLSVRSPSPPQPLDGAPSSPVQLLDFCLVNFFPLSLFGGDEEGLGEQADASRVFKTEPEGWGHSSVWRVLSTLQLSAWC